MADHTHHCLFGNNRKHSDEDGLTIPLCYSCHERLHVHDNDLALKWMRIAESAWLMKNNFDYEEYRTRYGKNYL